MREVGRVQQGFYPTPDRVVQMIATILRPQVRENETVSVVDAGCGEGKALHDLRLHWLGKYPDVNCRLLGVENEKNRAALSNERFQYGPGGGECLWGSIEDTRLHLQQDFMTQDACASMLWFNPPYDKIRGSGRLEKELFMRVCEWPVRGDGLIVMIVPDYVVTDDRVGLAQAFERHYTMLRVLKFPEPEYQVFKQCVVIGRRRAVAQNSSMVDHPPWSFDTKKWKTLGEVPNEIPVVAKAWVPYMQRVRLGFDVIKNFVDNSPVRGQMLAEALAEAPKIGRPPLSLGSGHLALALAGGLCDGIIENGPDDRFLVKGSLKSAVCKTGSKCKTNAEGEVTADIDIYKTRYNMWVRCLRSDGSIEDFTSADPSEELASAGAAIGEDSDEQSGDQSDAS